MRISRTWLIGSYTVGFGYIFLGYFLYDWSFHMVPYAGDSPVKKVAWDLFTDLYFVAFGTLTLLSSRLVSARKPFATKFYSGIFWAGLVILTAGQLGFSCFAYKGDPLEVFLLNMVTLLILHIPALVLYLTRKHAAPRNVMTS